MLNYSYTRPQITRHWDVVAGVAITEEGRALAIVNDAGVAKVNLSTGTSDVFAGIAQNHTMSPTSLPYVADITAVGTTLTLPFTPISGQIYLVNKTEGQVLTAGSASNDNEYSVSGTTVTLHSGESGDVITVQLRYAPTVDQILAFYGEGMPGAQADTTFQNRVGVITKGRVATTCFNVGAYTAGALLRIGASGMIVPSGGTQIANAVVAEIPTTSNHYIVVDLL